MASKNELVPEKYASEAFRDRDTALNAVAERLSEGNCLLLGMPKVGKTWLLKRLEEKAQEYSILGDSVVLYRDCRAYSSLSELCMSILRDVDAAERDLLPDTVRSSLTDNTPSFDFTYFQNIERAAQSKRKKIYLLLDHAIDLARGKKDYGGIEFFVEQFERLDIGRLGFLFYLLAGDYRLAQAFDEELNPRIKQIYKGRKKPDSLYLHPWDREVVKKFVDSLPPKNIPFAGSPPEEIIPMGQRENAIDTIMTQTGGHPYLVQVFCYSKDALWGLRGEPAKALEDERVKETIQEIWSSLGVYKSIVTDIAAGERKDVTDTHPLRRSALLVKSQVERPQFFGQVFRYFVDEKTKGRKAWFGQRGEIVMDIMSSLGFLLKDWWTYEWKFRVALAVLSFITAMILVLSNSNECIAVISVLIALFFALKMAQQAWHLANPF